MTLKEAAQKAISTQDARLFGLILDKLRNDGFNYDSCCKWFERWGLNADAFEALCYEADQIEAN